MSKHDYSRGRARNTAPLAAPSAFEFEEVSETVSNQGTHFMPGDSSKIFNPRTGKYVKLEGRVGQEVINEFGYPQGQQGGYSFEDLNNQLSQSFNDLYNNLSSAWSSLTGSTAPVNKPKDKKISKKASTRASIRDSVKALEEGEAGLNGPFEEEYYGYDEFVQPKKRYNKRRY